MALRGPALLELEGSISAGRHLLRDGGPTVNPHFHIRWQGHEKLDWERFDTRPDAEERAKELRKRDECYTIDEQGTDCPACTVPPRESN